MVKWATKESQRPQWIEGDELLVYRTSKQLLVKAQVPIDNGLQDMKDFKAGKGQCI